MEQVKFKKYEECYYNNEHCNFICQIDETESLVSIHVSDGYDQDDGYHETKEIYLPVETKALTKTKINIAEDFEKQRREYRVKLQKEQDFHRAELQCINQAKDLAKKEAGKWNALQELIDFVQGDFKWIVKFSYSSLQLIPFEEAKDYDGELCLLSFRSRKQLFDRRRPEFKSYIGQYSDDSGSRSECKFFKEEQEAIDFIIKTYNEKSAHFHIDEKLANQCGGLEKFNSEVQKKFNESKNNSKNQLLRMLQSNNEENLRIKESLKKYEQ